MRVTLRPHKEAIAALERNGFQVEPVRFGKGDHLIVRIHQAEASACIAISGSPSKEFLRPLLTSARRAVREAAMRPSMSA